MKTTMFFDQIIQNPSSVKLWNLEHPVRSEESVLHDSRPAKLSGFTLDTATDLPDLPPDLQGAGKRVLILLLRTLVFSLEEVCFPSLTLSTEPRVQFVLGRG